MQVVPEVGDYLKRGGEWLRITDITKHTTFYIGRYRAVNNYLEGDVWFHDDGRINDYHNNPLKYYNHFEYELLRLQT